jgi:hypothetical protein
MERPTGVTILSVLGFIGAGLSAWGACAMFFLGAAGMVAAGGRGMGGIFAALGAFAGVAFLILGGDLRGERNRALEIARLG